MNAFDDFTSTSDSNQFKNGTRQRHNTAIATQKEQEIQEIILKIFCQKVLIDDLKIKGKNIFGIKF